MGFNIPFTIGKLETQKKKAESFAKFFISHKKSQLDKYLLDADMNIERKEYQAIVAKSLIINLCFLSLITIPALIYKNLPWIYGLAFTLVISFFIFFIQLSYPRIYSARKSREIERNLISVMQDMLVQLDSGVPIFKIISNISESGYGELSREFAKVVKEINSGEPQIKAIDKLANRTGSLYFRRVLWQISNGMRAGSNMGIIIRYSIDNLNKEQIVQIQDYGSKLNPLVMFYMLITVILPALGLTFLTIIASMINLPEQMVRIIFIVIFLLVATIQIMFLGIIKTKRPSLI
jgi:pilus assembly protein TadC